MRSIRDCNVAVVGGAGFLGSHLVDHLIEDRGCRVLVVDNLEAGRREFVHPKSQFIHHDITLSEGYLRSLFQGSPGIFGSEPVRYVFNYAAWPYIPDSFSRPARVCEVNFNGAMNVINAAQEAGCEGILQVSSAEIYGEGWFGHKAMDPLDTNRLREDAPIYPHSSYGASKAAVDFYVQAAWRERQTPCIALRQFNCVGERETHPYIVPEIISQLSKWKQMEEETRGRPRSAWYDTPTVKLGNNSTRDFLYAGDAVRIAVELLERGQFGEVYNLGSETGIKMYDLAKLIGEVMGFADVKVEEDPARKRPWEIWSLLADNSKIKAVCRQKANLQPDQVDILTPLRTALEKTVKWYESNGRRWPWEGR